MILYYAWLCCIVLHISSHVISYYVIWHNIILYCIISQHLSSHHTIHYTQLTIYHDNRCDESRTESHEETSRQRGLVQVCLPSPLLLSIRSKVIILIIAPLSCLVYYCSLVLSCLVLFSLPFSSCLCPSSFFFLLCVPYL